MIKNKKFKLMFIGLFVFISIIIGFISITLANEKPKVTVVLYRMDSEYWRTIEAGVEKGLKDFGIDGKVIAVNSDSENKFLSTLKNVYKEKPDVLVVSPDYRVSFINELDKFVDDGIPVLLISSDLDWENKTTYIGTDNVKLGEKSGIFLASQLQPGNKVAILTNDITHPVYNERVKGARNTLEAAGIEVVVEKGVADDAEIVKKEMSKIIRNNPDLQGVFAINDTLAVHILNALKEEGLTIPVIGTHGTTDMIKEIEKGIIPGTVALNPYDMGYLSIENAVKTTKGEKVEKFIDVGVDIIVKSNAKERYAFLNHVLDEQ
jgi:ribose transport system substrate-binding protein